MVFFFLNQSPQKILQNRFCFPLLISKIHLLNPLLLQNTKFPVWKVAFWLLTLLKLEDLTNFLAWSVPFLDLNFFLSTTEIYNSITHPLTFDFLLLVLFDLTLNFLDFERNLESRSETALFMSFNENFEGDLPLELGLAWSGEGDLLFWDFSGWEGVGVFSLISMVWVLRGISTNSEESRWGILMKFEEVTF